MRRVCERSAVRAHHRPRRSLIESPALLTRFLRHEVAPAAWPTWQSFPGSARGLRRLRSLKEAILAARVCYKPILKLCCRGARTFPVGAHRFEYRNEV